MITALTPSETQFEQWCRDAAIECRRIQEARAQGHKRPDYAINVQRQWCIVEIKQLDQTPADIELQREITSGGIQGHWINPGARIRSPIRDAANQLRKFSRRGFPTVVCFFDNTVGFYLERLHIEQAMFGQETLSFEVSADPAHEPRFLGLHHGKKATLTQKNNTSISAVAVMRHPFGMQPVIDLYHNPHARIAIPHDLSAPFVQKQYAEGHDDLNRHEPTVLNLMQSQEWQKWLDDPEGECDREIERCLEEFKALRRNNSSG